MDCKICSIPMVVCKQHTMSPNVEILQKMEDKLNEIAKIFYKDIPFKIDKVQRRIPDHIHWHARK